MPKFYIVPAAQFATFPDSNADDAAEAVKSYVEAGRPAGAYVAIPEDAVARFAAAKVSVVNVEPQERTSSRVIRR